MGKIYPPEYKDEAVELGLVADRGFIGLCTRGRGVGVFGFAYS